MLSSEPWLERQEDVLSETAQHLSSEVLVAVLLYFGEVVLLLVYALDFPDPLTHVLRSPRVWVCRKKGSRRGWEHSSTPRHIQPLHLCAYGSAPVVALRATTCAVLSVHKLERRWLASFTLPSTYPKVAPLLPPTFLLSLPRVRQFPSAPLIRYQSRSSA